MSDFQKSFKTIIPSTYRNMDGIVESSPVKWQDIAGYNDVKQVLKQVRADIYQFNNSKISYIANVVCSKSKTGYTLHLKIS